MNSHARKRRRAVSARWRRPVAAVGAAAITAMMLTGLPVISGSLDRAHAAGAVYIDEPLQGGTALTGWSLQGAGQVSNADGTRGANWLPRLSTIGENNLMPHSVNTNACGVGATANQWPRCTASYDTSRDSKWLTLTTDNTNDGGGQAGTALHNTSFASDLGVVLEYDQRVYRTNNGRSGGTPSNQGGGDGIAVYLADANPSDHGLTGIDTTAGEAGGYGAGLGYSAVSNTGDGWCGAQQGVPGGYVGVGFDVYGNYQKAERQQGFGSITVPPGRSGSRRAIPRRSQASMHPSPRPAFRSRSVCAAPACAIPRHRAATRPRTAG